MQIETNTNIGCCLPLPFYIENSIIYCIMFCFTYMCVWCACVYVHMGMCRHVCMCLHMYVEARCQPCCLLTPSTSWDNLSLSWSSPNRLDWLASEPQGFSPTPISASLALGLQVCATSSVFLHMIWGLNSALQGKHFTNWALSPALKIMWLIYSLSLTHSDIFYWADSV